MFSSGSPEGYLFESDMVHFVVTFCGQNLSLFALEEMPWSKKVESYCEPSQPSMKISWTLYGICLTQ